MECIRHCVSSKIEFAGKGYIGVEEDDERFEEKIKRLTSELAEQMEKGKKLDAEIKKSEENRL